MLYINFTIIIIKIINNIKRYKKILKKILSILELKMRENDDFSYENKISSKTTQLIFEFIDKN